MLVRIYADDAKRIAEEFDIEDVATRTASWNEPEIRWHLDEDIQLIKLRIGGKTEQRIHHYFLLCSDQISELYAMDIIAEHCNKTRCYYVMPRL